MNIEELREYCLEVPAAEECMPFGDDTLVLKVMGRMFAFIWLEPKDGRFAVNLKCDPDRSIALRERYNGITPGYHSNKRLWITVYLESDVPDPLIVELVKHSVEEVIKKLPKCRQEEYKKQG
jgi:predicted DNA-binding protein (MmcQ/YjbR family)